MRKVTVIAMMLGTMFGTNAYAAGYGAAGCGLGSMIFGAKAGFVQLLAATTNGTSASQTFGISSGTSNCGDSSSAAAPKVFIDVNKEALAKDMSRGSGETINSLSALAGCNDSKAVGAHLQRSFKDLAPSTGTDAFSDNVLQSLRSEKSLACGRIS